MQKHLKKKNYKGFSKTRKQEEGEMMKTQFVKTDSLNDMFLKQAWGEAAATFKGLRGKSLHTRRPGSRGGSRLRARVLAGQS